MKRTSDIAKSKAKVNDQGKKNNGQQRPAKIKEETCKKYEKEKKNKKCIKTRARERERDREQNENDKW